MHLADNPQGSASAAIYDLYCGKLLSTIFEDLCFFLCDSAASLDFSTIENKHFQEATPP